MKVTYYGIVAIAFLATTFAYPSVKNESDVELIRPTTGGYPIIDVDSGMPGSPFDGLLETFTGLMTRMRQQMEHLFGTSDVGSDSFNFGGIPNIDLSKGNTTSVTKIIDGHKVVINETDFKQENKHGGTIFKVRVINVQPTVNTTNESKESGPESMENEISNSISKEHETPEKLKIMDKLSFDYDKSGSSKYDYEDKVDVPKFFEIFAMKNASVLNGSELKSSTEINEENIDKKIMKSFYNKYQSNKTKVDDANKHVISLEKNLHIVDGKRCSEEDKNNTESLIKNDDSFELRDLVRMENDIDTVDGNFQPLHYIGNDIDVNQKLAQSFAPINPDAEVFSDKEINVKPSQLRDLI